jgi:hypothetical protein
MSSNYFTESLRKRTGHFPERVAAVSAPTLTVITRTPSTAITRAVLPGFASGPAAWSNVGGLGGAAIAAAGAREVDGTTGATGGDGAGGAGSTASAGAVGDGGSVCGDVVGVG